MIYSGLGAALWSGAYSLFVAAPAAKFEGHAASLPDQLALLFGASTLAQILLTLAVGAFAIVGWKQLEETVGRNVETAIQERLDSMEMLMRGRVLSLLGYTMGELSTAPDQKEPTDRGRLAEAVIHCQSGYDLLKKTGEAPAMYMGLNNLVYYGSIDGDPTKGRFLLQKARELREAGDRYGMPSWLLSYCRAVVQFSTDPNELKEVSTIATTLLATKLTDHQAKEAEFYRNLASLPSDTGKPGAPP